ncbi:MAG: hypothetical protein LBQ07_00080 [Endomicrobium sp.]|jgi:hypothetical protein|nr:hypothetical protein [Endomicrobium sp.]
MKLKEIFDVFIREGINTDPRGIDIVKTDLLRRKEKYNANTSKDKKYYDLENFLNPYYDSRIIYGDINTEVTTIMVGIDIETPEFLLAKYLINSGIKIDLIVSHHPEGYAYSTFYNVIGMQIDILNKQGIPINIAEKIINNKINKVQRNIISQNTERVCDAAKLLNIPFMTAHTVADNHVTYFLQKKINELNPVYLKDILNLLSEYPEYQHGVKIGQSPFILNGHDYSKCGKVFVDMTGGTECPIESFKWFESAGIGTILTMYLSKESIKEAQKHHLNIIVAGHISSDNFGLNLLFDKLQNRQSIDEFKFIECSGFKRFKR